MSESTAQGGRCQTRDCRAGYKYKASPPSSDKTFSSTTSQHLNILNITTKSSHQQLHCNPPSTPSIIHIMPQSSITTSDEDVLHPLLHEAPPPEETLLESVTFPVRYDTQTSLKSKSKDCYNIIKFFMSGKGKYFYLFDICLIMKHLCKFPDFLPFVPDGTIVIPLSSATLVFCFT